MLRERLADIWFDCRETAGAVVRSRLAWISLGVIALSLTSTLYGRRPSGDAAAATVPMPAIAVADADAPRDRSLPVKIAAAGQDNLPGLIASLKSGTDDAQDMTPAFPSVGASKPPTPRQSDQPGPASTPPAPIGPQAQTLPPAPTVQMPPAPPNQINPPLPPTVRPPVLGQQPNQAPIAPTVPPTAQPPAPPPGQPPAAPITPAAVPKPGEQVVITDVSGPGITVEINRGKLVRLATPAGTVFIANPEIADVQVKSPKLMYIYGRRAGETALYAVDDQENVLLNARVVVTHNIGAMRRAINGAMPQNGIQVVTVGDAVVLSGDVSSATQVEDARRIAARFAPGDGAVVNNLRVVAANQVNLRVRIAEVSRDTLKQLGINWTALMSVGGFVFGLATGNPVMAVGGGFVTKSDGTTTFGMSYNKGGVDINGLVDALGTENLITVLAEPNLTALSGETANFLAGGEFPIPVSQGSGNGTTVEFKRFGVSLAFTPTVIDGNRINLKVRPEVSQLSSVGAVKIDSFVIPALTTRRAETTIELGSGQSFAIGGLLQNNAQQNANKVPLLGDIPILGALFKSDKFQRNETELVIIVTPYLVRPVAPGGVTSPTDGYLPPTDADRYGKGTMYRPQVPTRNTVPAGRNGNGLVGPSGFQLE